MLVMLNFHSCLLLAKYDCRIWAPLTMWSSLTISISCAGFQVLLQAAEQLIQDKPSEGLSSEQFVWLCSIMISATVVKLALWLYCRSSRNDIVRAYAKVVKPTTFVKQLISNKIFLLYMWHKSFQF